MTGGLTFVSAIEEEYTGNGTLAAARAGHLAGAALLLEPTELDVLLAGIGIAWVTIELEGRAAHAESALDAVNPILAAVPVIEALQALEAELNAAHRDSADPAFAAIEHPYNVNIGILRARRLGLECPGGQRDWRCGSAIRVTGRANRRSIVCAKRSPPRWPRIRGSRRTRHPSS